MGGLENQKREKKKENWSPIAQFYTTAKQAIDIVYRTRTAVKCTKMKIASAKRAKLLFFIVKYANF